MERKAEIKNFLTILIISGVFVIVSVLIILSLSWEKITSKNYFSNSDSSFIKHSCTIACTEKRQYDYCCVKRPTYVEKLKENNFASCFMLESIEEIPPCKTFDCSNACFNQEVIQRTKNTPPQIEFVPLKVPDKSIELSSIALSNHHRENVLP